MATDATFAGRIALLADDHELFRAGAAMVLMRQCGYDAVRQAGSFDEAMAHLEMEPTIALACFDLGMPGVGNPASLKQVRDRFPAIRLVVMTGSESRENILMALQLGMNGYIPKTLPMSEIVRAFRVVSEGGIYVPQQLANVALHAFDVARTQPVQVQTTRPVTVDDAGPPFLTRRQEEILRLIRGGRSNKEIGLRLGLSENTVKVHANALYRKLGVHTRQQAAALGDERGLRDGEPLTGATAHRPVAGEDDGSAS